MARKDDDATTAIQQEQWLLESVIPLTFNRLKSELENGLAVLSKHTRKADSLPLSSTQNEALKGFIALEGAYITKAELSIRLANERQIKTTITSSMPYFLEQIQQGANYLKLAAERMSFFMENNDEMQKKVTKRDTIELLEDLCQYVDRTELAFVYPNPADLFPYKICHPKHFMPPLRDDVVIEFCVHDVYLVCKIFSLDFRGGKSNSAAATAAAVNNPHNTDSPSCVTYKDKTAWIVDQCRTQTQSPMLTEIKACLRSIRSICQKYSQMLLQAES
ncbi:RAVE subunit 2/Rogdi [Dichotomocladium elegans]|nr:RAVE subunit 2/Rogdi [Dichotomocladium elegans]